MHGYYIELPRSQSERVPLDWQRRQTVKNAERYITPELKQFEDKVLGAAIARWRASVSFTTGCSTLDRGARAAQATAGALALRSTCSRISPSAR